MLVDARELWSPSDVARRLGISRMSVYRKIRSGELEAYRVGATGQLRIAPRAVADLLKPARKDCDA
jgi:excisionase family DNA binding protein